MHSNYNAIARQAQVEKKTKALSLRLRPSIWEKLTLLAVSDDRTPTGMLEKIVEAEYAKALAGKKAPQ